jgi:hypothetical protein
MTIVILDRDTGPLSPYPDWLRDSGQDVVLATPHAPAARGYTEVWSVADYTASARIDLRVLELAGRTAVTGIVATHPADLVRAGGLRDRLGIGGQGRDAALLAADPVAATEVLRGAGIPVVDRAAVTQASDLYWLARRWGYPLRVRARREPGWPTVATVRDAAEVRAFTDRGLFPDPLFVPGLMAEPVYSGVRHVVTGTAPHALLSIVDDALSALGVGEKRSCRAEVIHTDAGEWLVDTVGYPTRDDDERARRASVRIQAGLDPDSGWGRP